MSLRGTAAAVRRISFRTYGCNTRDAPVDERRDNKHRFHFADVAHLGHKICQTAVGPVSEILSKQKYIDIQHLCASLY